MTRFFRGFVLFLLFLLAPGALAQESVPFTGECHEVLAFVADHVEENYAGFRDKVPETAERPYERHRADLEARAHEAGTEAECHRLLVEYVGFFRDPHLAVSREAASAEDPEGDDAIRARFADRASRQVSEAEVRARLDRDGEQSPIEGIWEMVGADYRMAVLPDETAGDRYEAVILRADSVWWVPGQIKATFEPEGTNEYQVDYYMRDHSLREESARLQDGVLAFSEVSSWARVHPNNVSGYDPEEYRKHEQNRELEVRALDPNTVLLRLPDFSPTVQPKIEDLIEENWGELTSARNLIIDVRGNPGGGDASFHPVRPLLYTGPVVTPGLSQYATDENIRILETFLDDIELAADVEAEVQEMVAEMRQHRGGFVPAQDDTLTLDRTLPHPEHVAVLTDGGCVSSCESFVWTALQSDKVTVYGENTGGLLDYGDALPVETPSPAFRLHNPIARSNRVAQGAPLDNVGLEPDVRIPEEVVYWKRWVHEQLP